MVVLGVPLLTLETGQALTRMLILPPVVVLCTPPMSTEADTFRP